MLVKRDCIKGAAQYWKLYHVFFTTIEKGPILYSVSHSLTKTGQLCRLQSEKSRFYLPTFLKTFSVVKVSLKADCFWVEVKSVDDREADGFLQNCSNRKNAATELTVKYSYQKRNWCLRSFSIVP